MFVHESRDGRATLKESFVRPLPEKVLMPRPPELDCEDELVDEPPVLRWVIDVEESPPDPPSLRWLIDPD